MNENELARKIRQFITIDTSGNDNDRLTIRVCRVVVDVPFSKALYDCINDGWVTLPDGTKFDTDSLQLAFEQELLAKTGKCVLEHDYIDAGFPELARMVRGMRNEAQ